MLRQTCEEHMALEASANSKKGKKYDKHASYNGATSCTLTLAYRGQCPLI